MNVVCRDVEGVAVIDLVGRLTSTDGAGLLEAQVAGLVRDGQRHVVLNLAQLSYMDSGGLGEMILSYTALSKVGGAVRLAATTARIQDLLSITKLVTVFDSYETESLAVASFVPVGTIEPIPCARL